MTFNGTHIFDVWNLELVGFSNPVSLEITGSLIDLIAGHIQRMPLSSTAVLHLISSLKLINSFLRLFFVLFCDKQTYVLTFSSLFC